MGHAEITEHFALEAGSSVQRVISPKQSTTAIETRLWNLTQAERSASDLGLGATKQLEQIRTEESPAELALRRAT